MANLLLYGRTEPHLFVYRPRAPPATSRAPRVVRLLERRKTHANWRHLCVRIAVLQASPIQIRVGLPESFPFCCCTLGCLQGGGRPWLFGCGTLRGEQAQFFECAQAEVVCTRLLPHPPNGRGLVHVLSTAADEGGRAQTIFAQASRALYRWVVCIDPLLRRLLVRSLVDPIRLTAYAVTWRSCSPTSLWTFRPSSRASPAVACPVVLGGRRG